MNYKDIACKPSMGKKTRKEKAQVSTEYLIILAIVLVIALVVIYLIGSDSLTGPDQKEKLGKAAWAGATPIGVREIYWSGSTMRFYVRNNGLETITIRYMRFSPYAAASMNTVLQPQQERLISFGVWPSCAGAGLYYQFNDFRFNYDRGSLTNITQDINVPYGGRCD